MPLGGLVMAGLGAAVGIGKGIADISRAKKIKPDYKPFQISESAKRMQGLAQAQLNARNPYAAAQQRGILASQAGSMAGVQRAATSSSQALAAAAGLQAGTNQAMYQQGLQEQQAYGSRLATLFGAEQNMQQQEAMKFQEDLRKYMQDFQQKEQMRNAGFQSIVGGLQNIGGMMIGASQFGGAASQAASAGSDISALQGMQGMARRPITARPPQPAMNPLLGFRNIEASRPKPPAVNPFQGYINLQATRTR